MIVTMKSEDGEIVGQLIANKKTFSSGSQGYYGSAKLEVNNKRYQVQFQAVEIGSKQNGAER